MAWDTEAAAQKAEQAYRYVSRTLPPGSDYSLLDSHTDAAYEIEGVGGAVADAEIVPMQKGGPQTPEGKEVARWNATRHGISSPAPVVPGLEKQEDWQEHREAILEYYSPTGALQLELAERVALLTWRLRRVTRYEAQAIAISQEQVEDDFHSRESFKASMRGEGISATTHPVDIRFEAAYTKRIERAFRRFPQEKPDKILKAEAAGAIVFGAYIAAKKARGGELDWEALELPGITDDDIYELPAMKVEDVRGCIEAFATAASVDPDELFEGAAYEAGCEARGAAFKKEDMERDLSRKERERILPDADTLQKIARYEAHLSRQLYQALHALDILQGRREAAR
jgi:hypothetical protein